MAKVISLINQKGGVGKTTSTNAIAVCLKHLGYRVLCVDFDPQGYLTFSMGASTRNGGSIYDVLKHKVKCQYAIQKTRVTDIIPSDALLGSVEREFTGAGSERMLRDCLRSVQPFYDYILIDSPPELGLLSSNVIVASNVVLIPALTDGYSLQGIVQVHETILRIQHAFNPELTLGGFFLVRFYPREILSQSTAGAAELVAQHLGIPFLHTRIRHSNLISSAMTSLQMDIIDVDKRNNAVMDYIALVNELIERGTL